MSDTTKDLVRKAAALLQTAQPEKALELLVPFAEKKSDDVVFLEQFGVTLLENNQVEDAYQVLMKSCELDSEALQGTEKFLYLGQIIGGSDGVNFINTALNRLMGQLEYTVNGTGELDDHLKFLGETYTTKPELIRYLHKCLNQGIFAEIEIWMTDLCMEEDAESQCDQLIMKSLEFDNENPEAWSLLASIRISQQRDEDAKEALKKAWELFEIKKNKLEDAANEKNEAQQGDNEEYDAFEVNMQYADLLEPLLTVAKLSIETELYDIAISAASGSQDINESLLEAYYYEGLAAILQAKKLHAEKHNIPEYRNLEIKESDHEEAQQFLQDARIALTHGFKITQANDEDLDPEVVEQVNELLNSLGGPLMSELMPSKKIDEDANWEAEIEEA